jgi:hypothetical protein
MIDEQLEQQIVKDLGKHRSQNEIIRSVCEQGGLNCRRPSVWWRRWSSSMGGRLHDAKVRC